MKLCPGCKTVYPDDSQVCSRDQMALVGLGTEIVPGTVLRGKYEVISVLGVGGMATVYKVRHKAFQEIAAIKAVHSNLMQDAGFLKRFRNEAVIARQLHHPNAVRIDDFDIAEDGRPFIVMEFVDGRSLYELRKSAHGPWPTERCIQIGSQAAAALGAAHGLGIVHRDIKPSNILIVRGADGQPVVKVLDFGIAKVGEAEHFAGMTTVRTQHSLVIGTPEYMSPEQANGNAETAIDGRSDLYSLGLILYEMLTGAHPFHADTPIGMLMQQVSAVPAAPDSLDAGIPHAISALVLKCLQKDPADRFQNAGELFAALRDPDGWFAAERARESGPANGSATKVSSTQVPVVSEEARNSGLVNGKAAAEAAAITAEVVPVGVTGAGSETGRAAVLGAARPVSRSEWAKALVALQADAAALAKPAASKKNRVPLIAGVVVLVVLVVTGAFFVLHHRTASVASNELPTSAVQAPSASDASLAASPAKTAAPASAEASTSATAAGTNSPLTDAKPAEPDGPAAAKAGTETASAVVAVKKAGGDAPGAAKPGGSAAAGRGVALYGAGKYDAALLLLRKACDGGDTSGCVDLGAMYENGRGVAADIGEAQNFYRKGCDGGNRVGCDDLAQLVLRIAKHAGDGTQVGTVGVVQAAPEPAVTGGAALYKAGQYIAALPLLRNSCNSGDAHACGLLGGMYETGLGVERDADQAVPLLRKGCDAGDPGSCTSLGYMYEVGLGVTQDRAQANALYRKACNGGDTIGCRYLTRGNQ